MSLSETLSWYLLRFLEIILNIILTGREKSEEKEQRATDSSKSYDHGREESITSPFSEQQCLQWFKSLCNDKSGTMTPEDILRLCEFIRKSPSDIVFLVLAYKMSARNCGIFTEKEWFQGMSQLEIDSTQKLLNKWESIGQMLTDPTFERAVYRFAYDFSRERDRDGNNIDIGTGIELIKLFLGEKWKHYSAFVQFLILTKVKTITRDQYFNILEFSRSVDSLSSYDETAAWPVLMDEFVLHYNEHPDLYRNKSDELKNSGSGKLGFPSDFESEFSMRRKL